MKERMKKKEEGIELLTFKPTLNEKSVKVTIMHNSLVSEEAQLESSHRRTTSRVRPTQEIQEGDLVRDLDTRLPSNDQLQVKDGIDLYNC